MGTVEGFQPVVDDGEAPARTTRAEGSAVTKLYGTTTSGGVSNYGTLFKIETNGSGYGILRHFLTGTNGASPGAELLLSGTTLYGTTFGGGQWAAALCSSSTLTAPLLRP